MEWKGRGGGARVCDGAHCWEHRQQCIARICSDILRGPKVGSKGSVMAAYKYFWLPSHVHSSHVHSHMLHHMVSHLTGHMTYHMIHHIISRHNIGHMIWHHGLEGSRKVWNDDSELLLICSSISHPMTSCAASWLILWCHAQPQQVINSTHSVIMANCSSSCTQVQTVARSIYTPL